MVDDTSRPLTQYLVAASIDGFIADEHDNLDWLLQFEQDDDENPYDQFIADVGALAMGATTYEWVDRNHPGEWFYDDRPTWVFTHRNDLPRIAGANLIFTADDVARVHADMVRAAGGKNVWLVGGGELVGQFLDADLLDEIWLSVAPVVLGRGAPLLPRRRTDPMRLTAVRPTRSGRFVHLRYSLR